MNILMLSALDVWSLADGRGAPSLYRTLKAYGERGHHVALPRADRRREPFRPVSTDRVREPPLPQIPNVTFTRFPVPSIAALAAALAVSSRSRSTRRCASPPPSRSSPPGAPRRCCATSRSTSSTPTRCTAPWRRASFSVATSCRRSAASRERSCTRRSTTRSPALRRYEEVLALRTPADLYIMTNDGTRGDEVLARLNPQIAGPRPLLAKRPGHGQPEAGDAATGGGGPRGAGNRRRPLRADDRLRPAAVEARRPRRPRPGPSFDSELPEAQLLVLGDGEERAHLEALARELRRRPTPSASKARCRRRTSSATSGPPTSSSP